VVIGFFLINSFCKHTETKAGGQMFFFEEESKEDRLIYRPDKNNWRLWPLGSGKLIIET
jgi:hypothetical protein